MNKKGIILSVYIYVLLIFFLLVLASLLVVLSNTKKLTQRIKDGTESIVDSYEYGFSIDIEGPETICNIFGEDYEEPGFIAKDDKGNTLNVTIDSNLDIWKTGTYEVNYIVRFNNKEKKVTRKVVVYKPDLTYTGSSQTFTVPCSGIYKVETWGAQGGDYLTILGGKGAYSSGNIHLTEGTNIYVYVGQKPGNGDIGGYNGGGSIIAGQSAFGRAGGGATDVRLSNGVWNDNNGLKNRIIIAGGGGGANNRNYNDTSCGYGQGEGGIGGVLIGGIGITTGHTYNGCTYGWHVGTGGTQTSGGQNIAYNSSGVETSRLTTGVFGYATNEGSAQSGGGGGYYGGGSSGHGGAGGGSSFVSGCDGCNAIDINGVHTNQPIHYSGYKFNNIVMISGDSLMPSPSGSTETGHSGNGYAKITYLGTSEEVDDSEYIMKKFIIVPRINGVNIKTISSDNATATMVRYKTTPWTISDTTSTGTLLSSSFGSYNADDTWYSHTSGLTNGTTYYYKAFPYVNGSYRYLYKQNEATVTAGGLYGEYLFNGTVNDTSGNGYNPSSYSSTIGYKPSNIGLAGTFDGSSSYSALPYVLQSGTTSISTWIYMNSGSNTNVGTIISSTEGGGYEIRQDAGSNTYTISSYFGSGYQNMNGPASQVGKWTHVVLVINFGSKYVKLYHDGYLYSYVQYNEAYVPTALTGSDLITCIGCNPGVGGTKSNYFNGSINQLRIYNRELTKEEVLSLYLEG